MSESLRKTIPKETYFKIMELQAKYKCTTLQDLLVKMESLVTPQQEPLALHKVEAFLKVFCGLGDEQTSLFMNIIKGLEQEGIIH